LDNSGDLITELIDWDFLPLALVSEQIQLNMGESAYV
jgi:hypothetical protein